MKTYECGSIKTLFTWKPGNAPPFTPESPVIEVNCGAVKMIARISPKNARKLDANRDKGGKCEGKLVLFGGRLELTEASVQSFDAPQPKPDPVLTEQATIGSPALTKLAELVRSQEMKT